jgi:hypothetical protein
MEIGQKVDLVVSPILHPPGVRPDRPAVEWMSGHSIMRISSLSVSKWYVFLSLDCAAYG